MEHVEKVADPIRAVSRQRVFEELYKKAFPVFARFAARANGSFEDARDIFHDALVIYHEKSRTPGFVIRTTAEAYVVGIAKHLWAAKFRHDRHLILFDDLESDIAVPDDHFPSPDEASLLNFLEKTGQRCLELLRKFYFEKYPLRKIAHSLGYSNEHSAAVQKNKCITKMRTAIEQKSMNYEDFII